MLKLIVPAGEYYNEITNEFVYTEETVLKLEHSLAALARWESKWKKPFLDTGGVFRNDKNQKTPEEFYDYIRCMTVNEVTDKNCYRSLTPLQIEVISSYIKDEATATTFTSYEQRKFSNQKITAEIIYYWMTEMNIPFTCDRWHLNRLLALIRVCSIKRQKPKKRPQKDVVAERKAINAQRLEQYHTKG